MSFKLKFKDKDGDESVDIDFTMIEQTPEGMILHGVDSASGREFRFVWPLGVGTDLQVPPDPGVS